MAKLKYSVRSGEFGSTMRSDEFGSEKKSRLMARSMERFGSAGGLSRRSRDGFGGEMIGSV